MSGFIRPLQTEREQREGGKTIVYATERKVVSPRDLICKRVFNGSLSSGGRFYTNTQCLRKVERSTLCIDGQPTIELDIKSLHPRILYNMAGLEAPADCYDLKGYSRDTVKKVMLVALNAADEEAVCKALLKDDEVPVIQSRDIIAQLKVIHEPISGHFFSSSWRLLQFEDSCLTESIMLKALESSIPVLPVHDSYITATKYGFELMDIIRGCYAERYGFECAVSF